MIEYREEHGNLFEKYMDKPVTFAHCISADFALGAGIAKQFDERFHLRKELKEKFPLGVDRPCCIYINRVFNLVTKEKCFFKPNYRALDEALKDMAFKFNKIRQYLPSDTIVMPKIGCGLDRLEWYAVKPIIKEAFEFIDVRIIICNK